MKARRGFTLAEMIVVMALLVVVGGAISEGMRRQQAVFRSLSAMVSARNDVRDAAEVLSADLLSAAPGDTLAVATDSAVEFWGALGAGVSCDSAPGYTVRLPPHAPDAGSLSWFDAAPDTGDVLLLFNSDSAATGGQPRWERHRVAAVGTSPAGTSCPASTGLSAVADASLPAYVFALHSAASPAIRRGAPVRVLRRVRYSLYRSSDGRWYLGHRRCNASAPGCGLIQPLSGPYASHSTVGGGLQLLYLDVDARNLLGSSAQSRAAAVRMTVRGLARSVRLGPSAAFADSATAMVGLRNRD